MPQPLDLNYMTLEAIHVSEILDAASKHCPELKTLILPQRCFRDSYDPDVVGISLKPMMQRLYTALEKWHASNGGLVQLSVRRYMSCKYGRNTRVEARTNEFLTEVAKFCPKIEYLDRWKTSCF